MALRTDTPENLLTSLVAKYLPNIVGEIKIIHDIWEEFSDDLQCFTTQKSLPTLLVTKKMVKPMTSLGRTVFETEDGIMYKHPHLYQQQQSFLPTQNFDFHLICHENKVSVERGTRRCFMETVEKLSKNMLGLPNLHKEIFSTVSEYYNSGLVIDYRKMESDFDYAYEILPQILLKALSDFSGKVVVISAPKIVKSKKSDKYGVLFDLIGNYNTVCDLYTSPLPVHISSNVYSDFLPAPNDFSYSIHEESSDSSCFSEDSFYYYGISCTYKGQTSSIIPLSDIPIKVGCNEVVKFNWLHENQNATFNIYRSEPNPTSVVSQTLLYNIINVTYKEKDNGYDCDEAGFVCDRNRIEAGKCTAWIIPLDSDVLEFVKFRDGFIVENSENLFFGIFYTLAMYQPDKIFKIVNI